MNPHEEHGTRTSNADATSGRPIGADATHGGDAEERSTRMDDDKGRNEKRTWVEQVEVASNELVDRVRDLIEDGHARRVVIRDKNGDELLTAPLTFGVVAGGLITVAAPLLAALGALAALVSRVKLEILREVDDEDAANGPTTAEPPRPTSEGDEPGT